MAEISSGKQQQPIPEKELIELVERSQKRLEERMKRLQNLENHLGSHGNKLLNRARLYKTSIIILGATVATRIIFDEKCPKEDLDSLLIVMPYTLLSVIIAIIGGLDSAFKPGEVATEINFLKVRCGVVIDEVEQDWAKFVERVGVTKEALNNTDPLLAKLNKQCDEIETRLVQLDIPLAK